MTAGCSWETTSSLSASSLELLTELHAKHIRSGKPTGRPRLAPETEASIRAALQKGDMGMRKVAVQFGVATGTVQRIAREVGASVAA
jgi:hypothetical protein